MSLIFNDAKIWEDAGFTHEFNAVKAELSGRRQAEGGRDAAINALRDFQKAGVLNAGSKPSDLFRYFDDRVKTESLATGEFTLLGDVLNASNPVPVKNKTYEFARSSEHTGGITSMDFEVPVTGDKTNYTTQKVPVPIYSDKYGNEYRSGLAMADINDLATQSENSNRVILRQMNDGLFNGFGGINIDGATWSGVKTDSTIATETTIDIVNAATTGDQIFSEFVRLMGEIRNTLKIAKDIDIYVSQEIKTKLQNKFDTQYNSGTIEQNLLTIAGIRSIKQDPSYSGNQMLLADISREGLCSLVALPISSIALPKRHSFDGQYFLKVAAAGFMAKESYAGTKSALYASL